jgi:hypothetical protein
MTPKQARLSFFLLCAAALYASGIIPAIIPAAVPTANKIGNSAKFQLGASGAVAGDCPTFDASLNITGPGTGAGCGSSGSAGGGIVVYSGAAGVSLSGTAFFPVGGGSAASATETTVDADISASTTVSRFGANISVALGVGNSVAFTFRKNAADQTLTCTISGASATSCADTVNNFAVTPGDLIAIKAVFSGTIVVTPVFVLTAQTGSLAQGQVNVGTQFQLGQYATAGATLSGVTVPSCEDTDGNHLNFTSGTGAFSCGTSGGGGSTITSGAIASRPAAGTAGAVYLPTDSFYDSLFDTGAAWQYYVRGRQVTPPVNANFTWSNQGSSTITAQTNGAITMSVPAAATDSLHYYYIATPATPYTKTFRFQTTFYNVANIFSGVCFSESSSGKLICLYLGNGSNYAINVARWTNTTTFSANSLFGPNGLTGLSGSGAPIAFRLGDTGTNLTYEISGDNGGSWITLFTEARGSFFTTAPDRVGIAIDNNNSTYTATQTLISVD